jgi:hypothetical protein
MNAYTPRYARLMQSSDIKNIVVDGRYIIPFFSDRLAYVPSMEQMQSPFFVLGDTYKLSGAGCEDFTMPIKEYQLVAILDNANGIILDAVVMKQISGERSTIFSLTKLDCQNLGIEFQRGLQIFPKNLNWVKKENTQEVVETSSEVEFNSNILATYPKNYDDGLIHRVVIKISGFKRHLQGIMAQDNGHLISSTGSRPRFTIRVKQRIGNATNTDSATFPVDYCLPYKIVTSSVSRCSETSGNYMDEDGCIFLELDMTRKGFDRNIIGLNHELLGEYSFNDLFEVIIIGAQKIQPTNNELYDLQKRIRDVSRQNRANTTRLERIDHFMDMPIVKNSDMWTHNPCIKRVERLDRELDNFKFTLGDLCELL